MSEMDEQQAAILKMCEAHHELKRLGWRDAQYCPKDGSEFHVIECGSGVHVAHYQGEWPKGSWWIHEADDLWPSRPALFKLIDQETGGPQR